MTATTIALIVFGLAGWLLAAFFIGLWQKAFKHWGYCLDQWSEAVKDNRAVINHAAACLKMLREYSNENERLWPEVRHLQAAVKALREQLRQAREDSVYQEVRG